MAFGLRGLFRRVFRFKAFVFGFQLSIFLRQDIDAISQVTSILLQLQYLRF